jgi:hypothetical protein
MVMGMKMLFNQSHLSEWQPGTDESLMQQIRRWLRACQGTTLSSTI